MENRLQAEKKGAGPKPDIMTLNLPQIALENIPGMVVLADTSGSILHVNSQFIKTTQFSLEDMKGSLLTARWTACDASFTDISTHLEKNDIWHKGIGHLKKDGGKFQEVCSISKIPAGNGSDFYLLKVGQLVDFSDFQATAAQEELEKLRVSEESYRNVMEKSPIAIAINKVSDARYVAVNEAWSKRSGFKQEEVVGRLSTELNAYRDLDVRRKLWEGFHQKGYVDDLELAFTNKSGEKLYSLVSGRRIRFKGEDCLLYISTKIDALKKAQKVLAEREQNYRTIFDMAPYSITITKLSDGTYLQINEAFTRATGYLPEETIGRTTTDLNLYVDPLDRRRILDRMEKEGRVDRMEILFRKKNGEISVNLVSLTSFQLQGEACLISMVLNITSLKESQRALEESEIRFRTIFETAADPIFLNDMATGAFLDVNQAACDHLGYTRSEYLEMTIEQIHSHLMPDLRAFLDHQSSRTAGLFFEARHCRKDGSEAIVEISSRQMMHQDRPVLLSIVRDVTDRKQAEAQLAAYRENLEQMVAERTRELKRAQEKLINKEKFSVLGQLTATVSHELRNPLGVIRSSNFYLQHKIKSEDQKTQKHFHRIDKQVSICDAIVEELLEYTRGRRVILQTQDIASWVAHVVAQIQEQESIDIRLEIDPDLPPIPHEIDTMRRVLINLLNNSIYAVHAREEENDGQYRPEISVCLNKKGSHVVLCVCDNGTGMDDQTKDKAFEPLFTTKARGTGIGLANVRKIVENHEGKIEMSSRPGEGTCVSVILKC